MDYGVMVREGTVGRARDDQEVLTYYLEERSNDIIYLPRSQQPQPCPS